MLRRTDLRPAALLATGGLAVHELRYLLAPVPHEADGHGYLAPLSGLLVLVLGLLGARALRGIAARAQAGDAPSEPVRRTAPAPPVLAIAALLLACFLAQEMLEGLLAHGRSATPAAVLGAGGWLALPLSVAIAVLVALALRGGRELAAAATAAASAARPRLRLNTDDLPNLLLGAAARGACPAYARPTRGRAPPLPV